MATLRDVAAFAAKAVAAQAGMSLLGLNPGRKRKKDDTTKKALVVGTGLALLKGAASAGAGMATKALATKAGMAMLGLNPKVSSRRMSARQLRTFRMRAKQLDLARRRLESTLGKTVQSKTQVGRDLAWSKALGGIHRQIKGIKRLEKTLGIKRNPAKTGLNPIFRNPRIKWVPFGRKFLYAVESFGGRYPTWHWAVRRSDTLHGHAASGGMGHDSKAEAVAAAKDHITSEMARQKHLKMWERKHGPTFGKNPLLMVVPNPRKGDPLVLKTANEGHGFFGETAGQYGQAVAEYAWDVVFKELLKGGWKPYTVRLFLDARWGRHLADQVYIKGIPDKATIRAAVLKALKSEMRWIVKTMPEMDAERKLGGVRWNPGKKISANMISVTLHRNSYPTLIDASAARAIRGQDSVLVWSPAAYKNALGRSWKNLGRGAGYASGFTFRRTDPETGVEVNLVETFNSQLGAFILSRPGVRKMTNNPGRTLVHGGKGRDSVVLGWKSKNEAKAYVAKKNREGYVASVHPGRAGAPASAKWVTISSRHKLFMKGPWDKNPGARWHKKEYEDALVGQKEAYPEQKKYWEGVAGAHLDSYNKAKKIGPYASKNPGAAWHEAEAARMTARAKELERKGLMSMGRKYRSMAGDQEYSAAHSRVMAMPNPSYLLTPRVRQLRTIATSGVPGRVGNLLVDGLKVDPVTARAVLKFLAAQTHNWADTLAKEPVGRLIQYAYKNAKRR